MTLFVPHSFTLIKSKGFDVDAIASIASYSTFLPPKSNKVVAGDKQFSGVFSKMQQSVAIIIEGADKKLLSNLSKRNSIEVKADSSSGKGILKQFLKLPNAKLVESFNDKKEELKKAFNLDNNGNIEFFGQLFNINEFYDAAFLAEIKYLRQFSDKAEFVGVVLSSLSGFSGNKLNAAIKQLDVELNTFLTRIEKTASVQIGLYNKFSNTRDAEGDSSSSGSDDSSDSNDKKDDVASANYTGVAWISIFTIVATALAILVTTFMMVGVGDDCAKDTLLARSY